MDNKLVLCEWMDSRGTGSLWEHIGEIEPLVPDKIRSTGLVIDETNEYITLVQSLGMEQVLGRISIPRCAIVRMIELEFDAILSSASVLTARQQQTSVL